MRRIDQYIEQLFIPRDAALEQGLKDAERAGLPSINVSANEGKLLYLITKLAGATRVLEIGTLGGYSTTWLARALPANGRVVTLELEPKHAEVARKNLDRAGVGDRVAIRVGRAVDTLRAMADRGEAPFDVIFIDADKDAYVEYLNLSLQLSRPGTVILADNVIRNGAVLQAQPAERSAREVREYNAALAAQPRLDSLILPIIRDNLDGLSISIVKHDEVNR
ncbi:MAG TPA: O-methyltransferase [Anaerolineae bacterium]|nr:O-methyltransferase [Anaerolineae bacterium]